MPGYIPISRRVMNDTVEKYTAVPELKEAVRDSIARQELLKHEDVISHSPVTRPELPDDTVKDTIISLLKATGRENVERMISWMESNSFFEASASVSKHNAFRGGLARHSLEVHHEAMALDETMNLPETSVTLCSLLHDVCKADQFYVDARGVPQCNKSALGKGHGRRSMFLVLRAGLPLNYDEAMAIWWHMGEYEKSREYHQKEYTESLAIDLCKLIREADRTAADKAMPANGATE
ncbi:MAG: hypothetical protein PUA47_06385 [Bacteroidales bacterium]|nr:hypothetical protein [Bacteroidales bacterium]